MKAYLLISAAVVGFVASGVYGADKDTRAGNCEDAKSQYEYFCKGNSNDIMMQVPIACNNAKKNMAAACEGKVEDDQPYKFDDPKK
ncbi:MAG: hypothetical protein ABIP64_13510 [Burkholderiales bacterium]